jgi:hypothetical protein
MADEQERKPTIDERLEAIARNLELAEAEQRQMRAEQKRLDRRERQAREALLSGIAAYLRALADESGNGEA